LTPPSDGSKSSTPTSNPISANNSGSKNSGGSADGNSKNTKPRGSSQSAKKKIKFSTVSKNPKISNATSYKTQIWHQHTDLSFSYYSKSQDNPSTSERHVWGYEGTTTMYITQEENDKKTKNSGNTNNSSISIKDLELAIHFRGGCVVSDVAAYAMELSSSASPKNESDSKVAPSNANIKNKDNKVESSNSDIITPQKVESRNKSRSVSPETIPATSKAIPPKETQTKEEGSIAKLIPLKANYSHFDPLAKVFYAPTKWMKQDFERKKQQELNSSSTENSSSLKYEGDNFCHVGGKRMMRSLRVASTASAMGELRLVVSNISVGQSEHEKVQIDESVLQQVEDTWKSDLLDKNDLLIHEKGSVLNSFQKKTQTDANAHLRKMKRIDYIAKKLAYHSCPHIEPKKDKKKISSNKKIIPQSHALKVVIRFSIPNPSALKSSSGIHFMTPSLNHISSGYCAPYVYTTSGTIGDHQGPRFWIPCLDSASSKHRCSHELSIKVTAKREEGISAVGCGEDFGQIDTITRSHSSEDSIALYGARHHQFLTKMREYHQNYDPYALFSTSIFYTSIFTPIPVRSLGIAIGPFLSCPDPEYPDDIRQIYLAPLSLRCLLHSSHSVSTPKALHNSILAGTSGVPLRALSLTREILALPAFRSSTYTQVWLPACVNGGSSSGMWQQCQSLNSWLGGGTLDSNLLPPQGHRLPFYAGGRVLQMAQAHCAIMGWVVSSLPLGGEDDVGQGYIHSLISAQLMEIYERAHGGTGEGGGKASHFYVERFAVGSGLNGCGFLDFLPVQNVEEDEIMGGLGSGLAVGKFLEYITINQVIFLQYMFSNKNLAFIFG